MTTSDWSRRRYWSAYTGRAGLAGLKMYRRISSGLLHLSFPVRIPPTYYVVCSFSVWLGYFFQIPSCVDFFVYTRMNTKHSSVSPGSSLTRFRHILLRLEVTLSGSTTIPDGGWKMAL